MDKLDFMRLEFKINFGQTSYIAQPPVLCIVILHVKLLGACLVS